MATAVPAISFATILKDYENWLRYGTFVHEPLKSSLRDVLHNTSGDASYTGLPSNPSDLYHEFDINHRETLNKLLQKRVINYDQMMLLLPINNQETNSEKFDVTLLVVIIINFTNIPPPRNGWKDKNPPIHDQSKAANVIRARELRNFFHHTEPKDLDKQTLDVKWKEGDSIISALGYSYDSNTLKTASLDPTRLSVVHSLVQFLQIEQNALKKKFDSINAEDIKSSVDELKKNTTDQLNPGFELSASRSRNAIHFSIIAMSMLLILLNSRYQTLYVKHKFSSFLLSGCNI